MTMLLNPYAHGGSGGGGGGSFDPLNDVTWVVAYWADDPDWTDPGDGNAVSQWDDNSSGGNSDHLTQGTGSDQPIFRSSTTAFNNKATIEFDGSNDYLTTAFTGGDIGGATTIFLVGAVNATGTTYEFINGDNPGNRNSLSAQSSNEWGLYADFVKRGGTSDTNAHAFIAYFSGDAGFDWLKVDQTSSKAIDSNAGSETIDGLNAGCNAGASGNFLDGHIAFIGVHDGLMSSADQDDLMDWATDYYGI